MNNAKDLALLAHSRAIQEISEIQQRMALRQIVQDMHGDRALPLREFYWRVLGRRNQTLASAKELAHSEAATDTKRLETLYGIVTDLEETFAKYHEASD